MNLMLVDYLMQTVEEYNELVGEEKQLDWWEDVVDNIEDTQNEKEIIQLTDNIKREIELLKGN